MAAPEFWRTANSTLGCFAKTLNTSLCTDASSWWGSDGVEGLRGDLVGSGLGWNPSGPGFPAMLHIHANAFSLSRIVCFSGFLNFMA